MFSVLSRRGLGILEVGCTFQLVRAATESDDRLMQVPAS